MLVDRGRVTGLIDFAEVVSQPADSELDTILRWCRRPGEYPATLRGRGLDEAALADVPRWLHDAHPQLFEREQLQERLRFYDVWVDLAITAHHPDAGVRDRAQQRIARTISAR